MTARGGARPAKGTSLRAYAYEHIRDQIVRGELSPGTVVSEADLAASLGVSRSPVREAIQTLAREGLVEVFPQRGTLVARPSPKEVRESFELRAAVEGMAARLAAERRTPEELAAMKRILTDPPAPGAGPPYERAVTFHSLVVDAARSRYLKEAFETAAARIELISTRAAGLVSGPDATGDRHDAIYLAIEGADPDAAEAAMRSHLASHLERLLASMMG